jgi:hypothetical protein
MSIPWSSRDTPELWIPVQHEPLIDGDGALLRQAVSAWLRAVGRLKPGASVVGMAPRLTSVLRQWVQHDSGYPANWMPSMIGDLPKQFVGVVPAGAGVGIMKEECGSSLQILLEDRPNRLPGVRGSGLALYNPLANTWGEAILVAGHPAPTRGQDTVAW